MHNTTNSGQSRMTSLLFLPFNCLASLDPLLYSLLPDPSWAHQVNRDGEREGGAIYIGGGVLRLGEGGAGEAWPSRTRAAAACSSRSPGGRRRRGMGRPGSAGPRPSRARGFFLNFAEPKKIIEK